MHTQNQEGEYTWKPHSYGNDALFVFRPMTTL